MNISGRTALIAGGASGLGLATARRFARAGANVVLVDLPTSGGKAAAAELDGPARAVFAAADVTDEDDALAAMGVALELGDFAIAVNCAGIGSASKTAGSRGPHPIDMFRNVVDVNLIGTFNITRLAAQAMIDHPLDADDDGERGVIINTSSGAAFDGQIGQAAYAASKSAIAGMTLPIARDLSKARIRAVTIAPGLFDTPLLGALPDDARVTLESIVPHPQRLGAPDEFAMLAEQIATNPMLNGETIRLDGAARMPPS